MNQYSGSSETSSISGNQTSCKSERIKEDQIVSQDEQAPLTDSIAEKSIKFEINEINNMGTMKLDSENSPRQKSFKSPRESDDMFRPP